MGIETPKKFSFYLYTQDNRPRNKGITGFFGFLRQVVIDVNEALGGYYFSKDQDIVKIYLSIECNSLPTSELLIKGKKGINNISYLFDMNFELVINSNYSLSFFGSLIKSAIILMLQDMEVNYNLIKKVESRIDQLIKNKKFVYGNHE